MPITLHFEEDGALLEIVGDLSLADFQSVLNQGVLDIRYEDGRYLIIDNTKQTIGKALAKWEVEVLALFASGLFKEKKFMIANVVNPENLASLKAVECYDRKAVHPHAIFTNLEDARAWIQSNLKPD